MNGKIKILWISMYPPVSFASSGGSQTFNFYFKKFLGDTGVEINLISCAKYEEKVKIEDELEDVRYELIYWHDPHASKIQKFKNLESKYNPWNCNANLISNSDVSAIIKRIYQFKDMDYKPDIVIFEWTAIAMLAEKIHTIFPSAKLVASEHDVTYIGYERKYMYFKGLKKIYWHHLFSWEKKRELSALNFCDLILPHNEDNIEILEKEGIDKKKLMWLTPYFHNMSYCNRNSNGKDILFFGAMARPENYLSAKWFIDYVMPYLKDIDIRFVILGGNPPQELRDLECERIHVTGFVDSVDKYFEQSMCMVAPLVLGAGIKIKIIEGLSSGIPVLTNGIGIEGISAEKDKEYFHCETPEEYTEVIHKIYKGQIDLDSLEARTKSFINDYFSPEKCQIKYKQALMEILEQ